MPEQFKSARDYRYLLPLEDQGELDGSFSENVLYAAQAISSGFRVRGIESHSQMLVEPARILCAAFDTLRFVCRMRCLEDSDTTTMFPAMTKIFCDFDWAWTRFEHKICFCYFSLLNGSGGGGSTALGTLETSDIAVPDELKDIFEQEQICTVLLSETISHARKHDLFDLNDLQYFEPYLMIAIPRLSLVYYLANYNTIDHEDLEGSCDIFATANDILLTLKSDIQSLSESDSLSLERQLVKSVDPNANQCDLLQGNLHFLFQSISSITDNLITGSKKSHILSRAMKKAFQMHSAPIHDDQLGNSATVVKSACVVNSRIQAWRSNDPFPSLYLDSGEVCENLDQTSNV